MIDLTPIFQAVIALLAALITYKLIPWIKSKTTEQQQINLFYAAKVAVYAAEQFFGAGQGEDKLQYALDALKKAGYKIDTTMAREAIEKAVSDMNNNPFDRVVVDSGKDGTDDEYDAPANTAPVILDGLVVEDKEIPAEEHAQPITQGGEHEPPDGGVGANE